MNKPALDANLDILRALAVLAVFLCHFLQVTGGLQYGQHYAFGIETYSLGQVGVLLFFVHTCLVLLQSLERSDRGLTSGEMARQFYIRRAFRVYPLSICAILAAIAFAIPPNPLGVAYEWRGVRWLLANLFLVQNIRHVEPVLSPLWSLPFEVQMYLVLPLVFLQVRAPKAGARLAQIYVMSVLLSRFHEVFRFGPCFLAGAIAYVLCRTVHPRIPAWLWPVSVAGVIAVYTSDLFPHGIWPKDFAACLAVGLMIPLFRRCSGLFAAGAAQIAKYSYGIYLCHMPLLWLFYRKLDLSGWERAACLAATMVLVPVAAYYAIERPLIQMGVRFARRPESAASRALPDAPRVSVPPGSTTIPARASASPCD